MPDGWRDSGKIEFHYLLGERHVLRQYDISDYETDLENIEAWRAGNDHR